MQNEFSSTGAELEKDRCKGVEMREPNDTEKFTAQVFSTKRHLCIILTGHQKQVEVKNGRLAGKASAIFVAASTEYFCCRCLR